MVGEAGWGKIVWGEIGYLKRTALGHEPPFTRGIARTFKGRLHSASGHPFVKDECPFVGPTSPQSVIRGMKERPFSLRRLCLLGPPRSERYSMIF